MKFDAIVGNPPYQEDTGGGSAANVAAKQARPVYNLFVDQAKTMQPHYISMIMPARWYAGGIGLNDFRNEMLNDPQLQRLLQHRRYCRRHLLFPVGSGQGGGLRGYKRQRSGTPYYAAQPQ